MDITYNVYVPPQNQQRAKYVETVEEFLKSGNQNMCISFDEYMPTKRAYLALRSLASRRGGFKVAMRGWSVYCIKEGKDE